MNKFVLIYFLSQGDDYKDRELGSVHCSSQTISNITCKWIRIYYSYTCARAFKSSGGSLALRCRNHKCSLCVTAGGPAKPSKKRPAHNKLSLACTYRLFGAPRCRAGSLTGSNNYFSGRDEKIKVSVKSRWLWYCRKNTVVIWIFFDGSRLFSHIYLSADGLTFEKCIFPPVNRFCALSFKFTYCQAGKCDCFTFWSHTCVLYRIIMQLMETEQ